MTMPNRQWLIVDRPGDRTIQTSDFKQRQGPVPVPASGQLLVRVSHLAFDPSMKSWMNNSVSYFPPVGLGDVMPGEGYGEVIESQDPAFQPGDRVGGFTGWQDYAALDAKIARPMPRDIDPFAALSALGSSGLTAFFGLFEIGRPVPGDVFVVSSAAGAVGSMAVQFARLAGCRTIGIAKGTEKCGWITDCLGADVALDRGASDFLEQLDAAAPGGVDVYFDNVGGALLNEILGRIARRARVIICGGMSRHEPGRPLTELDNYYNLVFQRAKMEGFNVVDYRHREAEARARIESWLRGGHLAWHVPNTSGFAHAPETLIGIYAGHGLGKRVLAIAD